MSNTQLAILYDAHAPELFRFFMVVTGHEADTRDLLQDLFLRLAKRPCGEVLRDPAAWLYRVARNLITDQARRRGARDRALDRLAREPQDSALPASLAETGMGPPGNAAAALAALPGEQRAVVHLKIWENMTFARIAEVLDLPPNTVASRYRYAMEKLRTALTNPCMAHES